MIIADTSALLALYISAERQHDGVVAIVDAADEELVVSPFVIAELDYLIAGRDGLRRELIMLRELASGAYELADFDARALAQAAAVVQKYSDQDIGVTDASLVVLAERFRTKTILTLDRRHFDVLKPLDGGDFTLLP